MTSPAQPEWPGARWVGGIDATSAAAGMQVTLRHADGYHHARLLVRDGASVRGFVDVAVVDGTVSGDELLAAISELPQSEPRADVAELPSITVVVCTRDRAAHLRTALGAILRLDYPDFDVVVVDNAGRTSETRDLVRDEFADPRVRVVLEPVPGLSRARNTGLTAATGQIVAYTDDDVVVDSHWLSELAAGFARAPGVDCVAGLVPSGELRTRVQGFFDDRVSWSKNLVSRVYSLASPPADLPMFPFCVGEFGTGANFAMRRSAALELRGFDTAFGVGTRTGGGEDLDMFTRVILDGRTFVMQPSALVWHRHRDDLAALRVQARGYGVGLGAWLTKIALNPRTLGIALRRSPRAIARLTSLAWRRPEVSVVQESGPRDELGRTIARVGWYELLSVVRGPAAYFAQRLAGEGTMRIPVHRR
ncbi:MAG: glycosyltransferase [Burkholderiaceae bacterium]|nr:glycosyltransferase [Microbacteriaceae bacterium]